MKITPCQPLLLLAALMVAPALVAEPYQGREQNPVYTGWSWSGHVDHINLVEEEAAREGVEDTAFALGGAAEYYASNTANTLSLGLNLLFYHDNEAFAQYVEDYWGDEGYEESDANALMLFAEYGPKYRFGLQKNSFFSARLGVSGIFASERSISNCSNCYSEDIDIDGGVYGILGIGQTLGRIDIDLQFQQYFGGDLDNALRLKIGGTF